METRSAPPSARKTDIRRSHSATDDVIGSLGDALAGVSFENHGAIGNGSIFRGGHGAFGGTGMGRATKPGGHIPSVDANADDSWGNSSASEFTGFSNPFLGSSGVIPRSNSSGLLHRSASDVAVQSSVLNSPPSARPFTMRASSSGNRGFFGNTNSNEDLQPVPASPEKESLAAFLSQSPSQSLGGEFLKLGNTDSIKSSEQFVAPDEPNESILQPHGAVFHPKQQHADSPSDEQKRAQTNQLHTEGGRRNIESPSCSMTATSSSSRSASPSAVANVGSNIGQNHLDVVEKAPSDHLIHGPASNLSDAPQVPVMNSTITGQQKSGENIAQLYYSQELSVTQHSGFAFPEGVGWEQVNELKHRSTGELPSNLNGHGMYQNRANVAQAAPIGHFPSHQQPQDLHAQPQQMFYVAVPTQDGHQVFQPIQMIQVPGQPSTFMVPAPVGPTGMAPGTSKDVAAPMMFTQAVQNPAAAVGGMMQPQPGPVGSVRNYGDYGNSAPRNDFYPDTNTSGANEKYSDPNNESFGYPPSAHSTPQRKSGAMESRSPHHASAQNDVIFSLYTSQQRPQLESLLGHVRRLSRDQVGCRLLQQALDEEGPNAASAILNEGLSFWGDAMVDPFGNYLFQKILEKVTPEERIVLVRSVSTRLVNASLNLHGTRSVQKLVELCAADEPVMSAEATEKGTLTAAAILTRALSPSAARLCIDSHGNHVIQRVLLKLPHHYSQFVFDAVASSVGDVARHRHGCCVIQRCLDSAPSPARSHLVQRIVDKALDLMQDAYGNYVVQYVLDVCGDEEVQAVCESVIGNVNLLAIQKFSSNVMEKCFERCDDRVRELYMQELVDPDRIRELMMDPFGNYVVQRALTVATHAQAVNLVEAMRPHLMSPQPGTGNSQHSGGMRNTAGGRRIMTKICRRFPNFSLAPDSNTEDRLPQQQRGQNRHNNGNASYASPSGKNGNQRRQRYTPSREGKSPSTHDRFDGRAMYQM